MTALLDLLGLSFSVLSRQHRFWVTLATATTLSQAFGVFWSEVRLLMLDFEAFVFIRVHNWGGKRQGDEVGGHNNTRKF